MIKYSTSCKQSREKPEIIWKLLFHFTFVESNDGNKREIIISIRAWYFESTDTI